MTEGLLPLLRVAERVLQALGLQLPDSVEVPEGVPVLLLLPVGVWLLLLLPLGVPEALAPGLRLLLTVEL